MYCFCWLNYKNKVTLWPLRIKQILISCGTPLAEKYPGLVCHSDFKNIMETVCQDLAFQSWQITLQTNSLCDNYRLYIDQLEVEPYLEILLESNRVKLANLRRGSAASLTVKFRFLKSPVESCPFCDTPDEYHLSLKCESFNEKRKKLLPKYYYT